MDKEAKRVLDSINDYVEYCQSRSYPVAANETLTTLKNAAEALKVETDPSGSPLSPGQRELLSASEGVYEQVTLSDTASMSPGEREVLANQPE
jgi:hypothetical protein